MSAGAVRQGRVYVEIGADPKQFLSAVGQVNRQIGELGSSMADVGIKLGAIGATITAPIAAAAAQFGNLSEVVKDIQSYAGLGARDIGGLVKAAADLGIVLDKRTATAALQLAASTTKMRLALVGVAVTVGSIVAPEFTGFAEAVARVSKDISAFLRRNRQIITVSLAVGGAILGVGVALTSIGGAMKAFASNTSFLVGPITEMIRGTAILAVNVARLGVAFVVANPVAAVLAAALVAGSVAAVQAAGGFQGLAKILSGAFKSAIESASKAFPNLTSIVSETVVGSYNAIAAGDFAGAVGILWSGAKAAWTVGSSSIMGVLDPWIESVQNAWGNMVTFLANAWDRGFANLATSKWGGYLIGAFDNVINSVMALWDWMVGSLQKGWAWLQGKFQVGFDVQAEITRIDKENTARAEDRGRMRPGIAGRTGLTEEQKAQIIADADARIAGRIADNEKAQRDRRARTDQRALDRPGEIRDALDTLRQRIKTVAASAPEMAPIAPQQIAGPAQTAGTFSAFAARGMTFGAKGIAEQQIDILKQIAANTKERALVNP